jgi:hypothetical protein
VSEYSEAEVRKRRGMEECNEAETVHENRNEKQNDKRSFVMQQ